MGRRRNRWVPGACALASVPLTLALAVVARAPHAGSATLPATAVALPAADLIANPSFESGTAGWTGALTRVPLGSAAPHGRFVARAAAASGTAGAPTLAVDDWPGPVHATTVGVRYTGRLSVAAAEPATVGREAVLVVREHRGERAIAAWSSTPVRLTTAFRQLTATGTAVRAGDAIDLYAYVVRPDLADAIYLDAAVLTSSYPVPVTDAVPDPSFEQRGRWSVSNATLTRPRTSDAPDGQHIGVAGWNGRGRYLSVDDWPGVRVAGAGTSFVATALVGAGSGAAVGASARLIVREHTADGRYVTEQDSPALRLGRSLTAVSVRASVRRAGDLLDVYVALADPRPGAALALDAVSLARTGSTLGELALDVDQSALLGDTSRYAYVVLQESQYRRIPAIRAADPTTRVLAYEQVGSVRAPDACPADAGPHVPHSAYPLDYCWLAAHHPDWLLRDDQGQLVNYTDFPRNVMVDIGAAGLRAAWARTVVPEVRADGFDGVYLDDVNTHPGHARDGAPARYTDQQYGAATTGFVAEVGAALRSAGLLSMANVAVDPWRPWEVDDAVAMAGSLDAVAKEFWSHYQPSCSAEYGTVFTQPGSYDPATGGVDPGLALELEYARRVQAAGARLVGIDYDQSGDVARMAYGRAAFLLAWDGRPGSAYVNRPAAARDAHGRCAAVDPAEPAWTTDLGVPTGPAVTTGAVWSRAFTGGVVLLDPSPTAPVTVPLDGAYRSVDGAVVRGTVTLQPGSALVLTALS
jgi:hypothetical protein